MMSIETSRRVSRFRLPSRSALVGLGLGLLALTGCTEDEAPVVLAQAPSAASEPTASTGATPPVVELPEADGSIDLETLMSGLVLPDVVIGDPAAPITIVEYASMTCDHCAAFHTTTFPVIKRNYLDTGKAKMIIREFPFDPRATAAFMLARCAPNGNREAMIDVLFKQGEQWAHAENASEKLLAISKLAGFSEQSFKACLSDKDLQAKVTQTMQRGQKVMGVDSTPTFFINGTKYRGALKAEQMSAILDGKLKPE